MGTRESFCCAFLSRMCDKNVYGTTKASFLFPKEGIKMTIEMGTIYSALVDSCSEQIEQSLKKGTDHFTVTWGDFKRILYAANITDNPVTVQNKWDKMLADGIAVPLGTRLKPKASQKAVVMTRELLRVTGFYDEKKIKIKISEGARA